MAGSNRKRQVIIVGGGASGMAAAYAASLGGAVVTLLEQNEKLGKKVYITGKGRCNCTNASNMETVQRSVVTNPKFLYSAFSIFTNDDLIAFLNDHGCPTKTERGMRVFPVTDHASDVIKAFERALESLGVKVHYHTKVRALSCEDGECRGVVLAGGEVLCADAVILATGGISYPSTGSDGSGLQLAEQTGHRVTSLRPALVSLCCEEDWCRELSGLTLKNVAVRFMDAKKNKTLFEDFGELLFTHSGVSGPVVLSASSYLTKYLTGSDVGTKMNGCADENLEEKEYIRMLIDLKPALTQEQLDERILRDFAKEMNKRFKNALSDLLPASLIPVIVRLTEIDPEKPVNSVTKAERRKLETILKGLPLTVIGTGGFSEAIVTQGGVSVKDITPSTLESRRMKNLYFAGEMIDVDALTGGYNLQIAWATGYLACKSAAKGQGKPSDNHQDITSRVADPAAGKEQNMTVNVAIDGPAGAGKSTVAKRVAKELNYIYVDTGAMYRAIGLYFLQNEIDICDEQACADALPSIDVTIGYEDKTQQVYLNGENVSGLIRTQEVGEAASKTSAYGAVRAKLLDLQRGLAKTNNVLMDGRDIGTVILPNATVKIFLTASVYVRAKRRYEELIAKGENTDLETVIKEIEERDYRDSHRDVAPLKKAEDAIEVDSSDMTVNEVVDKIISIIREKTA